MTQSPILPSGLPPDRPESLLYEAGIYAHRSSYEENYQRGPNFTEDFPCQNKSDYSVKDAPLKFLGHDLDNPVGIPAGPLLNSNWVKFYLSQGFAVPVYKTVRSIHRACHPAPNCIYVQMPQDMPEFEPQSTGLPEIQSGAAPKSLADLSITNSFGVPSMTPEVWMPDIELANSYCNAGQLLIVSVLGTEGAEGRTLHEDFGYVAAMAKEAGAKVIEANFSCPNLVGSSTGMLYADAEAAQGIAKEIRSAIGKATPLLLKIGYLAPKLLQEIVKATRPYVDGYAGINTIPGNVRNADGTQALHGEGRLRSGICGAAIRKVASQFVRDLHAIRGSDDFAIVGVGGIMGDADLTQRLSDGADLAMSATAAMWDPLLAQRWLAQRQPDAQ